MLDKIRQFAEKYNMLPSGASVVCALSGGADSVFLLACLTELGRKLHFSVEALHVNHCLRGEESDRDELFCRELCSQLNVKFTAVSCNVAEYARMNSLSTEEAARRMRYDAFAAHSDGKLIATAHNANDNLETVLLNLARGTALKGIAGIPPVRGNIIRPILTVSRSEIEDWLSKNHFSYVTDSTNLSDDYSRNKIRHSIIPVLEELNGSVVGTSVSSIDALRAENDFIEAETDTAYKSCRIGNALSGLDGYHQVIRRRCIARLLSENHLPYSYDRLAAADELLINHGKINISGDWYLVSSGDVLSLENLQPKEKYHESLVCELKFGINSIFQHRIVTVECISAENLGSAVPVNKSFTNYYLDYDKIIGRTFLRNRKFGDRIRLSGRGFTSSVKKLINEKIPPDKREFLHFIDDSEGTIFAEGLGIAERVTPDDNTLNYMKITVTDIQTAK